MSKISDDIPNLAANAVTYVRNLYNRAVDSNKKFIEDIDLFQTEVKNLINQRKSFFEQDQIVNFVATIYDDARFLGAHDRGLLSNVALQFIELTMARHSGEPYYSTQLANKLYQKIKLHLSGEDLAKLISNKDIINRKSMAFQVMPALLEDAYTLGKNNHLFSDHDIILMINSLLDGTSCGAPEVDLALANIATTILEDNFHLLNEEQAIGLIANHLNTGVTKLTINQNYSFSQDYLNKVFAQVEEARTYDESQEKYILQFLLESIGKNYSKIGKANLSKKITKAINELLYRAVWQEDIKTIDVIRQTIDPEVIVANNNKLFFQSTRNACFAPKSDLNAIDTQNLEYPLNIAQNACNVTIKAKGNSLLVAHGYSKQDVYQFITAKASNSSVIAPDNLLTIYVNPGHGFLSLTKNNQSEIIGFYPEEKSSAIDFDYVSGSITWGSAFVANNLITAIVPKIAYKLMTATIAHPVIATLSTLGVISALIYDMVENQYDPYILKIANYGQKFLQQAAVDTVTSIISTYHQLDQIIGIKPAIGVVFATELLITSVPLAYACGYQTVGINLGFNLAGALSVAYKNDLKELNFYGMDFVKPVWNGIFTLYNAIAKFDAFSFRLGKIKNDQNCFKESQKYHFPKISFIINDEQYTKAKTFIEAIKSDCSAGNTELCLYQALSKNCYQFTQDVKQHLHQDDISFYSYLTQEQKDVLFINSIPMTGGSWKFDVQDPIEIELPNLDSGLFVD